MAGVRMMAWVSGRGRSGASPQVVLAVALSILSLPFLFSNAGLLIAAGLVPFLPVLMRPAAAYLLFFICFSYFRVHEAYPFLEEFSLPLILGAGGISAFAYTVFNRSAATGKPSQWQGPALFATVVAFGIAMTIVDPSAGPTPVQRLVTIVMALAACLAFYSWFRWLEEIDGAWGGEMRAFAVLFIVLTLGLPFARELGVALDFWLSTYWKIAATTLALAWLLRTQKLFVLATATIVGAGLLIAAVAIYNGLNGYSLVEGTRVSIGRLYATDFDPGATVIQKSALADPNDLALVLLFPLGFAVAGALKAGLPTIVRLLCLIALPCVSLGIVYTQSRGGAIGMLAVFAVTLLNIVKSRSVTIMLLSAAAVALVFGMALADRKSGGSAEYSQSGIDESAEGRLIAWEAATKMAIANPILGVGMNSFVARYYEYTPVWIGKNKAVHSTWFAMLAEGGPIALAIFVTMFFRAFMGVHRIGASMQSSPDLQQLEPVRIALLSALAGFAAGSTFLTQHIQWPLYIEVALAAALIRYAQSRSRPALTQNDGAASKQSEERALPC